MKFAILLYVVFQISCVQSYAVKSNVVIYGKTEPGTKIIRLFELDYNYTYPFKKTLAIDTIHEDGTYRLALFVEKPVAAVLIWDRVIIHPGDSIEINFTFDAPYNMKYDMAVVKGENAACYYFFHNQINNWNNWNSKAGCLKVSYLNYFQGDEFKFQQYYNAVQKEASTVKENLLQLLKDKKIKATDTALLFNEVNGDLFSYLLSPFYKIKSPLIIPAQYRSAIMGLSANRRLRNSVGYKSAARMFVEKILTRNTGPLSSQTAFGNCFIKTTAYYKDDLTIRDGLYVSLFNTLIGLPDSMNTVSERYFKNYVAVIKTPEYKKEALRLQDYFTIKYRKFFNKTLQSFELLNENEKPQLLSDCFKDSSSANYYYLDIWATWCFPCIMEIKDFEKYRNGFDSMHIKRIAISVDDDTVRWKDAGKKLFGSGDLSLLLKNPDQFRELLNIETVPRYILVTNKGEILSLDAPRSGEVEKIKEIIAVYKGN